MSTIYDELTQLPAGDAAALFDRVAAQLTADKDYHKLFDSRLMRKKYELGLPVTKPASLNDVPDSLRKTVEETYITAAREAGELFL